MVQVATLECVQRLQSGGMDTSFEKLYVSVWHDVELDMALGM